jgi:hypothetical protein
MTVAETLLIYMDPLSCTGRTGSNQIKNVCLGPNDKYHWDKNHSFRVRPDLT